jgi:hypothetical protein
MMAEEAAELITSMNHLRRGRYGPEGVVEEMVDVAIMLEELKIIFGQEAFDQMWIKKCEKFKGQLDKSNE